MRQIVTGRTDALVYPSELEAIDAVLYEPKESELIARQAFSLRTDDPEWAEQIGFDRLTRRGQARIHNKLGANIPLVDVDMERVYRRVYSLIIGWRITDTELQAARATGRGPDTYKAAAARRFIAEQENAIAFFGDSGFGIEGLFTATGRLEATAEAVFESNSTSWATANDYEGAIVVAHIRQARLALNALDGYEAQALILSAENYERMVGMFLNDRYDKTVLQFIAESKWFPGGIFSSSTIPNDRLAVVDNRPDQMQLAIPMDITRHEPWRDGPFSEVIPVEERTAGLLVRFPYAVSVVTGIGT